MNNLNTLKNDLNNIDSNLLTKEHGEKVIQVLIESRKNGGIDKFKQVLKGSNAVKASTKIIKDVDINKIKLYLSGNKDSGLNKTEIGAIAAYHLLTVDGSHGRPEEIINNKEFHKSILNIVSQQKNTNVNYSNIDETNNMILGGVKKIKIQNLHGPELLNFSQSDKLMLTDADNYNINSICNEPGPIIFNYTTVENSKYTVKKGLKNQKITAIKKNNGYQITDGPSNRLGKRPPIYNNITLEKSSQKREKQNQQKDDINNNKNEEINNLPTGKESFSPAKVMENISGKISSLAKKHFNEEGINTLNQEKEQYEKVGFSTLQPSDIYALTFYESNLQHHTTGRLDRDRDGIIDSGTGSTGTMQMTGVPIPEFRKIIFKKEKTGKLNTYEQKIYDHLQRNNLIEVLKLNKTDKNGKEITDEDGHTISVFRNRESPIRKKIYSNKKKNIALGLSYLKLCEARGNFRDARKLLENNNKLDIVVNKTSSILKKRGIIVDTGKLQTLKNELKKDKKLKRKFGAYARYNGEVGKIREKGVPYKEQKYKPLEEQNRFTYAMSVLYMGKYTFDKFNQ